MKEKENLRSRLKAEMKAREFTRDEDFARFLGVSKQYIGQIFNGQRSGERKVFLFAKKLRKPVEWLLGRNLTIPLVAEIAAGEPFDLNSCNVIEHIDIGGLPGIDPQKAELYYAVRIKDNSLYPAHSPGDILIVERNGQDGIKPGSRVIWSQEQSRKCYLKLVELHDNLVIMRCYNPSIPSISAPISEIANMHRVVAIIPA